MARDRKAYMRQYRAERKGDVAAIDAVLADPKAFEGSTPLDDLEAPAGKGTTKWSEVKRRKEEDPPIFPNQDATHGLPRSNYFGGGFAESIQQMPQKAIDAILDKVNVHKGRKGY